MITDVEGNIHYHNEAMLHILPNAMHFIENAHIKDVFNKLDLTDREVSLLNKSIESRASFSHEIRLAQKPNYTYSIQLKGNPYFNKDHAFDGYAFSFEVLHEGNTNTSYTSRAELKLFQSVFRDSSSPMIMVNNHTEVIDVNRAAVQLLGYSEDEFKSKKIEDYATKIEPIEPLWDSFINSRVQNGMIELTHKNGSIVNAHYQAVANIIDGVHLSVFTDLTVKETLRKNLVQKNNELKHALKQNADLMGIIAHDLRTPLNHLSMLLDLRAEDKLPKDQLDEIMTLITEKTHDNAELLKNLLYWADSQQEGIEVQVSEFDPIKMIKRVVRQHDYLIKKKGIKIKYAFPSSQLVETDENIFALVMRNFLSNSIKYSPKKASITIGIDSNNPLKFYVEDNGPGIPESKQSHIFQRGYRANTTKKIKGHGIGLHVSKTYVEAMGASIGFKSVEGEGSIFWLQLNK